MSGGIDQVRAVMSSPEDIDLPDELRAEAEGDIDPSAGNFGDGAPPEAPPGEGPPEQRCAGLPLNDIGNARRFVIHFGEDLIFIGQMGWHVWDGRRWRRDEEISKETSPEVRGLAQKMGALIEAETRYLEPSAKEKALIAEERKLRERQAELEGLPEDKREDDHEDRLGATIARVRAIEAMLKDHKTKIGRRLTHAKNAGNSGPIGNMIRESSVLLARRLEQMDAEAMEVNTESGVLRFSVTRDDESGMSPVAEAKLIPHERDQLLTKLMPVVYDPAAKSPKFDAFLRQVQPDPQIRAFLQRWFGLSMTGHTGEQKLVFLHGAGANGKSVLVDLMARIIGDYAATAKIESLTGKNRRSGGDATPDLVPLIGARFVRASEPEEGERLQEGKIKELTGGEPILVRALNMDFVQVTPKFKLTISGNHKPDIRGTDDGIWRRFLMVPFDVQIAAAQRDPFLVQKLWEERSGILNWLRDGCLDWMEGGLREPDAVLSATQDFREESDPVANFLTDATAVSGSEADFITARELIEAFNFWLEERGETRWGGRTASNKIKAKAGKWKHPVTQMGFIAGKSGVTGYRGLRLTDTFARRFNERPQRPRTGEEQWDRF